MDRTDWKLKQKLQDADTNKLFAFGRVIETSSSVLIEVFRKMGPADTNLLEIEKSGIFIFSRASFLGCSYKREVENHWKYNCIRQKYAFPIPRPEDGIWRWD